MGDKTKNLLSGLLFGGLLIAVTFKFYNKDINLDLNEVDKIYSTVVASKVTEKSSIVGGKTSVKGDVFNFRLSNSDENFAVHRPSQNYSDLIASVKPGDTISVYYRKQNNDDLNLDVYQIEKNGTVLQDYKTRNTTYKNLSWLTGIVGFGLIAFGIWQFFRRKRN